MYCVSFCNETVEGPLSRVSLYSFCKFLFLLPFVLTLFRHLFICNVVLIFISPFPPFFLPTFPFYASPYSLPLSCLYFFLPFHLPSLIFLGLCIFFHLFLSGCLLSLIPELFYPSIIYLFVHPSFFFLSTFKVSFPLYPFLIFFLSFLA